MLHLIASKARNAVSRDKFRFMDGELDLDLTYITDRIIAMGLPGKGVEKVWRNEIDDVARFFRKYHADHFIIINLSGEIYDYSKFDYRVKDYGYPDHSSLPLDLLYRIMSAMKYYLDEDPANVVAVHCLAGRGRTGTVVSAFLLHIGLFTDATEALRYFANTRSSTGEGVITPSQIRYVSYFNSILQGQKPDPRGKEKKLVLEQIIMEPCAVVPGTEEKGIEGGWTPVVQVCTLAGTNPEECLYSSNNGFAPSFNTRDHPQSTIHIQHDGCVIQGDIQIKMFHHAKNQIAFMRMIKDGDFKKVEKLALAHKSPLACLFRCSFHTDFVNPKTMRLSFKKSDLDGMFSGPCHVKMIPDNFRVTLKFREHQEPSSAPPAGQQPPPPNGGVPNGVVQTTVQVYGQAPGSNGGTNWGPPPTSYPPMPAVPPPFPSLPFPDPSPPSSSGPPSYYPGPPFHPQQQQPQEQQPYGSGAYPPLSQQQQQPYGGYPPDPGMPGNVQYYGHGGPSALPPLPSAPTHMPYPPATTPVPTYYPVQQPPPFGPPATYTSGVPQPQPQPPPGMMYGSQQLGVPPPSPYDPFAPLQFPSWNQS